MSQLESFFVENADYFVEKVPVKADLRQKLEALGVFEGAPVTIFLQNRTGAIVKLGKTKLALSKNILKMLRLRKNERRDS